MKIRTLFCLTLTTSLACSSDEPSASEESSSSASSDASTDTSGETSGETGSETGSTEEETGDTAAPTCWELNHAIVADIDETLTLSDGEFLQQLVDSTHDPLEREGAHEMISAYHDLGYNIVYLTARAENQASTDDAMVPARQLTEEWLMAHDFPFDEYTQVQMADSFVFGDSAAEYKSMRLMELQGEGLMFDYAYGNADSDITAYENAGIDKAATFIIGENAGNAGTVAIEGEGWVDHTAAHLPTVTDWCAGG